MFNKLKPKIIILSIIALLTVCTIYYVNYLINQPLDIDPPKQFVYNNITIPLAWTDDNENETLIIQSDKKTYTGFNQAQVYFSITNLSRKDQDMDIVFWFEDEEREVESVAKLGNNQNYKLQITNSKQITNYKLQITNPEGEQVPYGAGRKPINGYTNGQQTTDTIASGDTNYYLATISYPAQSQGEFFIEAFGCDANTRINANDANREYNDANSRIRNWQHSHTFADSHHTSYGHLDPWYNSSWLYRKQITIDNTKVGTTTSSAIFPVLATTTDSDLASHARSDAYDIVFTKADGQTTLNWEREKWDNGTGELVAWIQTDISSTTDTVLYMYYGNSGQSTDMATTTGVWEDSYKGVWHLPHNTTASTSDSTKWDNDGSAEATASSTADGWVDGGFSFDGDSDYVDCGSPILTSDFTIVAWFSLPDTADEMVIYAEGNTGNDNPQNTLSIYSDQIHFKLEDLSDSYINIYDAGPAVDDDKWHHVAGTYSSAGSGNAVVYVDGVEIATDTGTGSLVVDTANIAVLERASKSYYFKGTIDEVRILNIARTEGWIKTEYNNQVSVDSFLTFGPEEDNTPTEFISTICQSPTAGGDCANGDYHRLYDWEDAVECDLTASSTRVFAGTLTGALNENADVTLMKGGATTTITAKVVATTSDQILVDGISGLASDGLVAESGDVWKNNGSNYWTITGTTGDELGNTAIAVAKIDGAWTSADTQAVTIDDWTTGASNYIRIYTTETARHDGIWDTGKYRLTPSGNITALNIVIPYTQIDGLQIYVSADAYNTSFCISIGAAATSVLINHSLLRGNPAASNYSELQGIYVVGSVTIRNSILWDFLPTVYSSEAIFAHTGSTVTCQNVTIHNSQSGFYSYGWNAAFSCTNCLAQGCTDGYGGPGAAITGSYNCSDIASDAPGTNSVTGTVTFVDSSNADHALRDFHLAQNDSTAKNAGTNLYSTAGFQDDIDGDIRPASNWDIGADEAETPTEFVCSIMETSGDYHRLYDWEAAIDCDLTASTTRVYSFDASSGCIPDNTQVTTDSGNSTSTLLHMASSSQVLLIDIDGSFDDNDVVTDGSNTVTLSNNGAPAIAVAKIDGAWNNADTQAVTITDWTTSTSTYIKIYTTDAARHNGVWDTNAYRLNYGTEGGITLTINESYVKIEGLQVNHKGTYNSRYALRITNVDAVGIEISYSIIKLSGSNGNLSVGISLGQMSNAYAVKIWNCLVENPFYSGIDCGNGENESCIIYNTTVVNCGFRGIVGYENRVNAKNCLVYNCSTDLYTNSFSNSDYNATDGANNTGGANDKTGASFSFINADTLANGGDFHLAGSDTDAKDAGVDLSGDSNLAFDDDIDGQVRPGPGARVWDIGADEVKKATMLNTPITDKYTSGLVGHWTFNGQDMDWSSSTAEALDRSGQGNNGNVVNGAAPIDGVVGQALEFDGVDDYVDCGNVIFTSGDSITTEDITVSAWVKTTNSGAQYAIGKFQDSTNYVYFRIETDYMKFLATKGGTTIIDIYNNAIGADSGQWTHIAVILPRGNTPFYYKNGISQTLVGTTCDTGDISNTGDFHIARRDTVYFNGIIDEVRIYNRALSEEEILDLYQAGAKTFQTNAPITQKYTSGLVGHWTFNGQDMDWGSSTAEVLDRSGQGNNGDVTNFNQSAVTGGISGQALEFDGVDDYVVTLGYKGVTGTAARTTSAWFKTTSAAGVDDVVISWGTSGQAELYSISVESGVLWFRGGNNVVYGGSGLNDGVWHLATIVHPVSATVSDLVFYVDGVFTSTTVAQGSDTLNTTATQDLNIGRLGVGSIRYFNGLIDEVRVYNRALSAEEIEELYQAGVRRVEF